MATHDMDGTITIVQESRFQMTDDQGAAHLFLLGPNASAEPAQLAPLAARQARVRVRYRTGENIVGALAEAVFVIEPETVQ
jgi:hypothetical protein